MSICSGIPKGALVAINDLLEHCIEIEAGQEVTLLAQIDGLYGGDNLVDKEAIDWIASCVRYHGANASVLWIDEPAKPHEWRFPPVVQGVIQASDVLINHSFDLVIEEITKFRQFCFEKPSFVMARNFATTAPLLNTAWAQTPYELVSEIRYQSSLAIKPGLKWQLTDDNETHLEGVITPSPMPFDYSETRKEAGAYRPWPEWVHPPIGSSNTSGIFIFDCMLSWWSRYIGICPYFSKPIQLTIENDRIKTIQGGDEAEALKRFLTEMRERLGDGVYDFNCLHFGIHPQAAVTQQQCPNILHRRLIEHSHSSNIHVHIGAPPDTEAYPYWMHCTGDIRKPTFRVGNKLVHDRGHLTALDSPAVLSVAAKYPGRPGLQPTTTCAC